MASVLVKVGWDVQADVVEYRVQFIVREGEFSWVQATNYTSGLEYEVGGVWCGEYTFRIAVSGRGNGGCYDEEFGEVSEVCTRAGTAVEPPPPQNLRVSATGRDSVTLRWEMPSGTYGSWISMWHHPSGRWAWFVHDTRTVAVRDGLRCGRTIPSGLG